MTVYYYRLEDIHLTRELHYSLTIVQEYAYLSEIQVHIFPHDNTSHTRIRFMIAKCSPWRADDIGFVDYLAATSRILGHRPRSPLSENKTSIVNPAHSKLRSIFMWSLPAETARSGKVLSHLNIHRESEARDISGQVQSDRKGPGFRA